MQLVGTDKSRVVVGLGKSGLSCARYLYRQGISFSVVDSRQSPPGLEEMTVEMPDVSVYTGSFECQALAHATELIMSPGVALANPAITEVVSKGASVVGDIELFAKALEERGINAPVVAITGSNGKSTVTTLIGEMAVVAGLKVAVGGNIGTPALELLDREADIYILELSSFQLETTFSLTPAVATVLNISADHMDRYSSLLAYQQSKQRIYRQCRSVVYNRDDVLTQPLVPDSVPRTRFTLDRPDLNDFGLLRDGESLWIAYGQEKLLCTSELKLKGLHNYANALAALAIGSALTLPLNQMLAVLREFSGLEHRCQWVGERNGVDYFNDSKATNPGAAIAALEGLGASISGKVVLIAGGDGKGADFSSMHDALIQYARKLILLGRDAEKIQQVAPSGLDCIHVENMMQAVELANKAAVSGDAVLLAPACASFDMYKNFEDRGHAFCDAVRQVLHA